MIHRRINGVVAQIQFLAVAIAVAVDFHFVELVLVLIQNAIGIVAVEGLEPFVEAFD